MRVHNLRRLGRSLACTNFVYGFAPTRSFAVAPRQARLVCRVDETWAAALRKRSDEKCILKGILLRYDAPPRSPF